MPHPAIARIQKTCIACPAQWQGVLASGETFYVRYRHGFLTIGFGADIDAAADLARGPEGYEWENPDADGLDGWMEWEEAEPHFNRALATHVERRDRKTL
ncbi:MAG: hypothetical protein SGJ21_01595 [Alphaproteobacteria bacterium]|nr:hypothetical protein [Alphaproteobacteria bacterium]